jgi:hypothetical protein
MQICENSQEKVIWIFTNKKMSMYKSWMPEERMAYWPINSLLLYYPENRI